MSHQVIHGMSFANGPTTTELRNKFESVHFRAATDDVYRAKLKADPAGTLRAAGIDVPAGVKVVALELSSQNLAIGAGLTTPGNPAIQWPNDNGHEQQWAMVPVP